LIYSSWDLTFESLFLEQSCISAKATATKLQSTDTQVPFATAEQSGFAARFQILIRKRQVSALLHSQSHLWNGHLTSSKHGGDSSDIPQLSNAISTPRAGQPWQHKVLHRGIQAAEVQM